MWKGVFVLAALAAPVVCTAEDEPAPAPAEFPALLNQLQREENPNLRGGESVLREARGPGRQVVELLGRPDTWDGNGTQALRDAVIARWRRQWQEQGVRMLNGVSPAKPIEGRQDLNFGPIHHSRDMSDMRTFYFLAGPKIYSLGALDGSYPPTGRMLGDQSGIWTQPVKLLNGISYTIVDPGRPDWTLVKGREFATDLVSGRFSYERENLRIARLDFAAEDRPAFFSRLTIQNKLDRPYAVTLQFAAAVNIRPNWGTRLQNDLDQIIAEQGSVYAQDPLIEGGEFSVGGELAASEVKIQDNIATLSYRIELPARGSVTRTFLVLARPGQTADERRRQFEPLAAGASSILAAKQEKYRKLVFEGVRFTSDDKRVEEAFYLAKANLQMLTADLRPYFPAPYFYAGFPVYMQLFSNDTSYSITGATAAGFIDTSRGTLVSLADQAKQNGGWFPHEVATSGRTTGLGNSQEIQQTIGAAWRYFRWTADLQFLKAFYPQARQSLDFALKRFDSDGDGYPEGPGLIETNGMGAKKVDAATYLYEAYCSIAGMARVLGDPATSKDFTRRAGELKVRFNKDWWIQEQGIWADSLTHDNQQRLDGFWSVIFPQGVGLASPDYARTALDTLEQKWVNHWGLIGKYDPGQDMSERGIGVVHNTLFATTLFRAGRVDSGLSMLLKGARAPFEDRMLGAFVETIPPGGSDFIQLWSIGPFLEAVIEGLAGVHPDAQAHRVELSVGLPAGLNHYELSGLKIGTHTVNISHRRRDGAEIKTFAQIAGDRPLTLVVACPVTAWSVKVNGAAVRPQPKCMQLSESFAATFEIQAPPGATVEIATPGRAP